MSCTESGRFALLDSVLGDVDKFVDAFPSSLHGFAASVRKPMLQMLSLCCHFYPSEGILDDIVDDVIGCLPL